MATETVGFQIAGINNQITDDYGTDNDLEVAGGGRGWTASTTRNGAAITAKGTSKLGAAEALAAEVARLAALEADAVQPDDMSDAEFERCVAECMVSERDYCECKCMGANHGAGSGRRVILLGAKLCECGCGETTQRRFVPGHDARFHAIQGLYKWWDEQGFAQADFSEDEARKLKLAAQRKAARERRAARRAAQAALDEKAAKVAASIQAEPKRAKRAKPVDDLPF